MKDLIYAICFVIFIALAIPFLAMGAVGLVLLITLSSIKEALFGDDIISNHYND